MGIHSYLNFFCLQNVVQTYWSVIPGMAKSFVTKSLRPSLLARMNSITRFNFMFIKYLYVSQ